MEFYRGRLIDHIQLVVRDLDASRRFYEAVLGVIGVPVVRGDEFFWADELFVSPGEPKTGRVHLAFQAATATWSIASMRPGLRPAAVTTARPASATITQATTRPFCSTRTATIEAVHHGPAKRSAEAVVLTAEM
jgi:catechol 2,3-dioxygenase-like lactoylglutathione lyase family enzyme